MAVSPLEGSSLGIPGPYAIPLFALLLTLAIVPLVDAHLWDIFLSLSSDGRLRS
ncbi:hypothetical protein M427DRAFT_60997, partial [Gonapodya prolifera JEL478]